VSSMTAGFMGAGDVGATEASPVPDVDRSSPAWR
jgi:hypothetical protein